MQNYAHRLLPWQVVLSLHRSNNFSQCALKQLKAFILMYYNASLIAFHKRDYPKNVFSLY